MDSFKTGSISEAEVAKAVQGLKKDFPSGIPAYGTDALRYGLCHVDVKSEYFLFFFSIYQWVARC